jgi:hypothetical protein
MSITLDLDSKKRDFDDHFLTPAYLKGPLSNTRGRKVYRLKEPAFLKKG